MLIYYYRNVHSTFFIFQLVFNWSEMTVEISILITRSSPHIIHDESVKKTKYSIENLKLIANFAIVYFELFRHNIS